MAVRSELAMFLRSRRDRLAPHEVGLPGGGRRRTPGLRRQEVAELAGISIDYYIRLEQARGSQPSAQVLSALARAFMLRADERDYLFRLAGYQPPELRRPTGEVAPTVRHLLDTLTEHPAYVVDAKYDLLAWNRLMTLFIGDPTESERPNIVRWLFDQADEGDWPELFARRTVADLRAAYARYPGNRDIETMVTEMLAISTRFARMWAEHEVEVRGVIHKRIDHPTEGSLEFACEVLHLPATDQRLIIYCAEPGSVTQAAFRRLAHGPAPERATWQHLYGSGVSSPRAG
jgi:transcriptional regulator with XRE-family HTH domain